MSGMRDSKEFVEIFPTNAPSDGIYSRQNGTHILNFNLASTDAFVKGGSMRLCFKVKSKLGNGDDIVNVLGAGGVAKAFINPRLGAYQFWEQLTIANREGMTIEEIRYYNRCMATLLPMLHSEGDIVSALSNEDNSSGDFVWSQVQNSNQVYTDVSMRLYSGLLYNERRNIPLSATWGLRGLSLTLQLCSDSQVFFNLGRTGTPTTGASANGGAQFEISDVSLQCEYVRPGAQRLLQLNSQTSGLIEYNSFSSLYSVVNSANHNFVSDLGSKNVVSCFGTFLPVIYNNSTNGDAFTDARMVQSATSGAFDGAQVDIEELSFTRDGVKFPQTYVVKENVGISKNRQTPHSQVLRGFIDAVKPFRELLHSVNGIRTANLTIPGYGNGTGSDYTRNALSDKIYNGGSLYGIGVAYDAFGERGADFRGRQFGLQIKSTLGKVGAESPHALFLFFLNRETMAYSPSGIQVAM